MTRPTARGQAIGAQTRVFAKNLGRARVRYWQALLARPQLAGPIVEAIRADVDTDGWSRKLSVLVGFGEAWRSTRRAAERDRYLRAVERAAEWLSTIDRDCRAANACHLGIGLWASRTLPDGHRWRGAKVRRARVRSRAWRHYWARATEARRDREHWRNSIVVANEGLAISQVAKWAPWAEGHLSREDLQQAAREGLHRAADLFDPDRGFAFSTYAANWIRHAVFRLHQQQRSDIRAPSAVQALALDLAPILEVNDTRDPEELLALLAADWKRRGKGKTKGPPSVEAVSGALEYLGMREVSFDAPIGHDPEARTLADLLPSEMEPVDEMIDRERVLARMLAALEQLPPEDRGLLEQRYGLMGPEQTSAQLARARARRRQEIEAQERRALGALRSRLVGCEHTAAEIGG